MNIMNISIQTPIRPRKQYDTHTKTLWYKVHSLFKKRQRHVAAKGSKTGESRARQVGDRQQPRHAGTQSRQVGGDGEGQAGSLRPGVCSGSCMVSVQMGEEQARPPRTPPRPSTSDKKGTPPPPHTFVQINPGKKQLLQNGSGLCELTQGQACLL